MAQKDIKDGVQRTLLVAGGALAHRSISKLADKMVQKSAPSIAAKPMYHYGKEGALALIGALAPSFLKGKSKELATGIGIGLAGDAILSIISKVSKGKLAGDDDLLQEAYTSTPISAYLPTSSYYEPASYTDDYAETPSYADYGVLESYNI